MAKEIDRADIRAALLAFAGTPIVRPGRHEPAQLFRGMREVLQVAGGRELEDARVRDAADTFLRKALFFDAADHYALLGLSRTASTAEIKEHYRLLMRMVHPDFSRHGGWPADAAARLNRAYDVLGDPARRERYDAETAVAPAGAARSTPRAAPPARTPVETPPIPPNKVLKGLAAAFGTAGLAGLGLLYWTGGSDPQQTLVQRADGKSAATGRAPTGRSPARAGADAPPHASTEASSIPASSQATALDNTTEAIDAGFETSTASGAPPGAAVHHAADRVAAAASTSMPSKRRIRTSDDSPPSPRMVAIPATQPEGRLTRTVRGLDLAITRVSTATTPRESQQAANLDHAPPISVANAGVVAPPAPAPAPVEPTLRSEGRVFAAAPPSAAAPVAKAAAAIGPSLADVQPQLSRLLQHLERGTPERIAAETDPNTGASTGADSFTREYARVVGLGRPVHVIAVQLQSTPGDGSLVVHGHVSLRFLDPQQGATDWQLPLWTEFRLRHGVAVMTSIRKGDQ